MSIITTGVKLTSFWQANPQWMEGTTSAYSRSVRLMRSSHYRLQSHSSSHAILKREHHWCFILAGTLYMHIGNQNVSLPFYGKVTSGQSTRFGSTNWYAHSLGSPYFCCVACIRKREPSTEGCLRLFSGESLALGESPPLNLTRCRLSILDPIMWRSPEIILLGE